MSLRVEQVASEASPTNLYIFSSGFQANITIQIPKEHHRYVIGKEGKKLRELEQITMTKITIPNSEENSDYIKIIGPKEGIDQARHELQLISDEQVITSFAVTNKKKEDFRTIAHYVISPPGSLIEEFISKIKQIHFWYFWEKQVYLTEFIHISMGGKKSICVSYLDLNFTLLLALM